MELAKCPLTMDEKTKMIADAAFFRSENASRDKGPVANWLEAEKEIEAAVAALCSPFEE